MSRYKTKDYSNRREYLDWLAERYGVDRADVVLLASILGTDQDFDGLPSTLADLPAAKHDYGTEAAYHAPESAPKPGECSKAGDRPERAQETAPPENGPGTVTAALAPLSAPAWHFDSKMPLVRGSAPDTPAPPKVPSI